MTYILPNTVHTYWLGEATLSKETAAGIKKLSLAASQEHTKNLWISQDKQLIVEAFEDNIGRVPDGLNIRHWKDLAQYQRYPNTYSLSDALLHSNPPIPTHAKNLISYQITELEPGISLDGDADIQSRIPANVEMKSAIAAHDGYENSAFALARHPDDSTEKALMTRILQSCEDSAEKYLKPENKGSSTVFTLSTSRASGLGVLHSVTYDGYEHVVTEKKREALSHYIQYEQRPIQGKWIGLAQKLTAENKTITGANL
jgi:hypothetical protein